MNARKTLHLALIFMILTGWTITSLAQSHSYGALQEETMPSWIKPSPPVVPQDGWDEYCDLSPNFPPVGNQGGQGSCTCWAVGYYYKTYQEWEEHGWDLNDYDHRFSPAFIYNQINGGNDNGSYPSDAFKLLCDNGATPYSVMPYTDQNCTTQPTEEAFYTALPYRSLETYSFDMFASLDGVKAHLLNGHAAVFAFTVYENFDNISSFNYTYCLSEVTGPVRGGHAVTLCGFDDNRVTSDGIGAFKVANSWGGGWGEAGYFWMSYEAMQSPITCWGTALYCSDRIDYEPTLVSVFRVEHDDRYAMEYQFGVGEADNPDWSEDFFNFYGGISAAHPYAPSNIIVDLTDGASFITSSALNDLFMRGYDTRAWNGLDGSITDFTVVELTWPATSSSPYTPVPIPDDGSFAYTALQLTQGSSTPVAGNVSGTWSASGSPYYVTDNLTVSSGATLTIEPGTEVLFLDNFSFEIDADANLQAVGTSNEPIVFSPLISAVGWKGIRFNGASSDSRLEQCHIRSGKAIGEGDEANGGGVYCNASNLTITQCLIEQCQATLGAAIYCENANPEITNNTIQVNISSESGGGIYCQTANPNIAGNTFYKNSATDGSAISCVQSDPLIENNTFTENNAVNRGGAIFCEDSNSQIRGSFFTANSASKGAGIASTNSTLTIEENVFYMNTGNQGGAFYSNNSDDVILNNSFEGNDCPTGGAIHGYQTSIQVNGNDFNANIAGNGGAINVWFSEAEITNNTFTNHLTSGYGGGIYMLGSQGEMSNNVFGANLATKGGGVYLINSDASAVNCTFTRNVVSSAGGAIAGSNESNASLLNCIVYDNLPDQLSGDETTDYDICYTNIQDGWEGVGNIDDTPYFMTDTDYHLANWSPSIGAGIGYMTIGETTLFAPAVDIEGNDRPNPAGSNPDQGAYENELGAPTAVEPEDETLQPSAFSLQPCFPNPFNPVTAISYQLSAPSLTNLTVYNVHGRLVATLVNGWQA